MSGNLLGLAYGSSSEDEEPEEAVKPESEPKDEEESDEESNSDSESGSDSDDEEGGDKRKASAKGKEDKNAKPAAKKSSSGLPAALDLLETVAAPSFLDQPKREPEVTPIFRPSFAQKKQQQPGHWNKKRPSSSNEQPPPHMSQPPAPPKASFPPPSQGGAQASKKPKTADKDKKDVKERVKDQRMKGQSGIGDDFRVWRTDDEMRMRQAYD